MMEQRSFAEILDECIDRMLVQGETVEACVRDFPEHAVELREALSAGVTIGEAFAFLPAPDRKRAARLRLHEAIERRRRRWGWLRLPLAPIAGTGSRLATVALVALIVVLGSSTGTVLAARDSAPGELLYPVMRASERVQLAFAVTDERSSTLHTRLMERRMRELDVVTSNGRERFVPDLVRQIEHHSARAQRLAVGPVRSVVERLPALDDSPDDPAVGATLAREPLGMTPGSPSRREVSVRRMVLLNDQMAEVRRRIAGFEERVGEGPGKRDIAHLREVIEQSHQRLQELLDRADRAHQVRGAEVDAPTAPLADARYGHVAVRITGIKVVHDGKNLLGIDVSVVAEEDGTAYVAHLTRRGTKLIVDGKPGRIRQLKLDQQAVLIVDPASGEILELQIGHTPPDA